MKGNLLFEAQDESTVIIGKKPITANTASNPTSTSATTQPGATGINETKAAAVPTKSRGAAQKIGLSALAGMIISFEISFNPSLINCKIPSTFQQYSGPTRSCIFARNFLSMYMVAAARRAANPNPGKAAILKKSVCKRDFIIGKVRDGSAIHVSARYGVRSSPLISGSSM